MCYVAVMLSGSTVTPIVLYMGSILGRTYTLADKLFSGLCVCARVYIYIYICVCVCVCVYVCVCVCV